MNEPLQELEGTWEEVAAHAPELRGHRVRLKVLDGNGNLSEAQARPHSFKGKPITDFDAYIASIPHFDGAEEEVIALDEAIAEERAERRRLAELAEDED